MSWSQQPAHSSFGARPQQQYYGGSPSYGGYQSPPSQSLPPQGYQHSMPPGTVPQYQQPAPPPPVDPELMAWFKTVDSDGSGKISAIELQQALTNNNWSHFNAETCRLLIGMFDQNSDGNIDVYEFSALWKYIKDWRECFDRYDKSRTGFINTDELFAALQSFGYSLSMDFCKLCTRVFDRNSQNSMKLDDFIQCCTMLRSLSEGFKRLDTDMDGVVDVNYEQFLELALENTIN